MPETLPIFMKGERKPVNCFRDAEGFLVIDAVLGDDDLTVVSPDSGEERFRITDGEVTDLRPHKHEWDVDSHCTVCHKSQQQINEEQDEQTHPTAVE
jgi:hypothetical protein